MIDTARLTIGLLILFGGLFVVLTGIVYWLCDRQFWKSLGLVAATYAIVGVLVFFIIAVVAWSFDKSIWEVLT